MWQHFTNFGDKIFNDDLDASHCYYTVTSGATFSKLVRKIFGRLLFLRKDADLFRKCFWKNLGRYYEEDFEKGCTFLKLLWKNLGKCVGKH